MTRQIAILGSTGSIGTNALRVIDALGPDYNVVALSAHNQVELLAEQVRRYRPRYVAISRSELVGRLREQIGDWDVEVLTGPASLVELAELAAVDTVLIAVVGAVGLQAAVAAARRGKRLAIANKEPLVIAGELLTDIARRSGSEILPVDSEHSAIFQAMQSGTAPEVRRILLTGSGGPFREATVEQLAHVTVEQALAHPVWQMGPKITIDSATMMNKALEVIEARWLFDVCVEQIEVLIHPESIVHSLVEFVDGSVIAQLSLPDMCLPIQYALTYPKRVPGVSPPLRLDEIAQLRFETPDMEKFRALSLAYEVARAGGTAAAVFNAANEAAVELFLAEEIGFADIMTWVQRCLDRHQNRNVDSVEELLEVDAWARRQVLDRRPQAKPGGTAAV